MAMSTSPKDCPICDEEYDENVRCPRILSCFHSLCTACIENLIKNNKRQCPFCRCSFSANSSKDVNINYGVLDLINYYTKKNAGSSSLLEKVKIMKTEALEINSFQSKSCQEAKQRIEKLIDEVENAEQLIEQENRRLESEVLPKIQTMIIVNNKSLADLKQSKMKQKKQLSDIEGNKKRLNSMKQNIKSCPADTITDICKALNDADKFYTNINSGMNDIQDSFSMQERSLGAEKKKTLRVKEKVSIILDLLNTSEESEGNPFLFQELTVKNTSDKSEESSNYTHTAKKTTKVKQSDLRHLPTNALMLEAFLDFPISFLSESDVFHIFKK